MRRPRVLDSRLGPVAEWRIATLALLTAVLLAGCSREKPAEKLSFENLSDTTSLSEGAPLLESFQAYRMQNGAARVHGVLRLPDSTKVQVAIKKPGGGVSVAMTHVVVIGGTFDSPPMLGDQGALPKATYQYEISVHFNPDWQPLRVLQATNDGRALRGPGITRARNGEAVLFLTREGTL